MQQITAPIAVGEIMSCQVGNTDLNGLYVIAVHNDTTAAGPLYRVTVDHGGCIRIAVKDLWRPFADEVVARSYARQVAELFRNGMRDTQVIAEMNSRTAAFHAEVVEALDTDANRRAEIARLEGKLMCELANPRTIQAEPKILALCKQIEALKTPSEIADENHAREVAQAAARANRAARDAVERAAQAQADAAARERRAELMRRRNDPPTIKPVSEHARRVAERLFGTTVPAGTNVRVYGDGRTEVAR